MKPKSQILLGLQSAVTLALILAAFEGQASLRSDGLHIDKIAHDRIGLAILLVCLASCVIASCALASLKRDWRHADGFTFLLGSLTALSSASAYANAAGTLTINGRSPELVSWPAFVWIATLFCILVFSTCRTRASEG